MKYSADEGQWNFSMSWNVLVSVSRLAYTPRKHKVKDVHKIGHDIFNYFGDRQNYLLY